jgi:hypothetical protein
MRLEIKRLEECVAAREAADAVVEATVGAAAVERIADAMLVGPRLEALLAKVGADPEAFAGAIVERLGALVARALGDLDIMVGGGVAGRADRTMRAAAREGVGDGPAEASGDVRVTAAQVDKIVLAMVEAPKVVQLLDAAVGKAEGDVKAALPGALTPALVRTIQAAGGKVSGYSSATVAGALRGLIQGEG